MRKWFLLALLLAGVPLFAQTNPGDGAAETPPGLFPEFPEFSLETFTPEDPESAKVPVKKSVPLWLKDLHRGEIVAFGSFPFAVFFTGLFMDLYRCAAHDWDRRYAPWPAKSSGAVPLTTTELKVLFGVAASVSLTVALADYIVVRVKRSRAAALE
ncbi:MAG: hypothetical protein LBG84_07075 [Treponema sp.]|jgi:hypothetical protein|nr:hypothetical protein [Treponema sp.]